LLRAKRQWPIGCCRPANKRDEIAPFQPVELHSILVTNRGCIPGYRIGKDKSAGGPTILQPTGCWPKSLA
jgi:hypothetical protein